MLHSTLCYATEPCTLADMSNDTTTTTTCTLCHGSGLDDDWNPCACGATVEIIRGGGKPKVVANAAPARGNGCGRGAGKPAALATVKQVSYLRSLIEQCDATVPAVIDALAAITAGGYGLTMAAASKHIDALRNLPKAAVAGGPVRSNRYPGKCGTCGRSVAVLAGRIAQVAGKWVTYHLDGECPTAPAEAPVVPADGLDLAPLAKYTSADVVRFAVPQGETRLKLRLAFKNGTVWVTDAAEYGNRQTYGSQRPGQAYRGKVQDALRAILADPMGALAAYGHLTSTCGVCGRPLEDADSVARGIGPICAGRL